MTNLKSLSFLAALISGLAFAQTDLAPEMLAPSSARTPAGHVHSNHYFGATRKHESLAGPFARLSGPDGLAPSAVLSAYGLTPSLGSAAIAIVVPFDLPSALNDFNTFSQTFSLPTETSINVASPTNTHLQVLYVGGSQPNASIAWGSLAALTIEWAHAIAPNAKIYLVEAKSDSLPDIYAGVSLAKTQAGVAQVVMPWGADEYASEASDDHVFLQPGVTFFAPTGDFNNHLQFPAASPYVVGVAGTNLDLSGSAPVETAWTSAAVGISQYEPRPAAQNPVSAIVGTKRGSPDIAVIGDPLTSVAVYSQFAIGGWTVMGGSSLSSAVAAAIANDRGQFSASSSAELSRVYQYLGTRFFRDITGGSAGSVKAGTGYDLATGAGSPQGLYTSLVSKTYDPSNIVVENGTHTSGSLASLNTSDGDAYKITSKLVSGTGQVAQYTSDVPIDHLSSQMVSITLQLGTASATTASVSVYAYNWKTLSYDLLTKFTGTVATSVKSVSIDKWAPYFSASKVARFRVVANVPGNTASAFTLGTDLLTISGTF